MRLSAELFEEISQALRSDLKAGRDQRIEPRVGMSGEVTLISRGEDGLLHQARVRVRDISRSGLGLYINNRFTADQSFVIELQSTAGEPIWLICVAAYCREAESDGFIVGGRIKDVANAQQIRDLQGKLGDAAFHSFLGPQEKAAIARVSKAILS